MRFFRIFIIGDFKAAQIYIPFAKKESFKLSEWGQFVYQPNPYVKLVVRLVGDTAWIVIRAELEKECGFLFTLEPV